MPATPQWVQFYHACWNDQILAVRLLAENPFLLEDRGSLGETALHHSAIENGLEVVRFLLSRGASCDARGLGGATPLQECTSICDAGWDLTAIIALLLKCGADPFHQTVILPCAWHLARVSGFPALRSLFERIPPPSEQHECCEFYGLAERPG